MADVAAWLNRCGAGLEKFAATFTQELVTGRVLFEIDEEDLKSEFGMEFGLRRRFLQQVDVLKRVQDRCDIKEQIQP